MNTNSMTIAELQSACQDMWNLKGYHTETPLELGLGIAEEAGEIAKALLLTQAPNYVPAKRATDSEKDVAMEVGDLMTYLFHLCNFLGITPRFDKLP